MQFKYESHNIKVYKHNNKRRFKKRVSGADIILISARPVKRLYIDDLVWLEIEKKIYFRVEYERMLRRALLKRSGTSV